MFAFLFKKPTARELAIREKEEAERLLLEAHTGRDYADSQVAYQTARIRRIDAMLLTLGKPVGTEVD